MCMTSEQSPAVYCYYSYHHPIICRDERESRRNPLGSSKFWLCDFRILQTSQYLCLLQVCLHESSHSKIRASHLPPKPRTLLKAVPQKHRHGHTHLHAHTLHLGSCLAFKGRKTVVDVAIEVSPYQIVVVYIIASTCSPRPACRKHTWFYFFFPTTNWKDFEDPLKTFQGCYFLAYVGSTTTSTPSGLLNNISKAIKASFQEDASGSAVSGWESQPNYFQLVVNCGKVDFTSLELLLALIKSLLCWRQ